MGHSNHSHDIDLQYSRPIIDLQIGERESESAGTDRCRMYQMIDGFPGAQSRIERFLHRLAIDDIDRVDAQSLPVGTGKLAQAIRTGLAQIPDRHLGTFLQESLDASPADPARTAGDDGLRLF